MHPTLDVTKRLLKVDKVIGEATVRKVFESTVTLPIQAVKVFDVVANLSNIKDEVRENGVLVTGTIKKQLFVVDEGDVVRHVSEDVPFRIFVDVEGARPGFKVQVRANIIDIEAKLINDTEVRQEVLIEIFVKVTKIQQIEVVTDVKGGPKDLKVKKKLLKVDGVIGEDRVSEAIRKTIELPITAKKIFQIVSEVQDVETEIKRDVVIVRGTVHKQIFLVDEGDLVRHVSEDVPFSVAVDIPGAKPDFEVQVNVDAVVDEFELINPPSRKLRQIILLDIFVKVTETLQIDIVVDVKGTGIVVERKLLKVEQVVSDVTKRKTLDSQVELTVGADKIFRIIAEIKNIETKVLDDKVLVKAVLHKQIFFVDKGGLLRHQREDIPFQIAFNVPGAKENMNVQVRLKIIGDIDFELISKNKVQQTAIIEGFIKVTETEQLEVVVDVRIEAHKPDRPDHFDKKHDKKHDKMHDKFEPKPGKKVVIVKKGDTMFLIAKREGVTLEALIKANPQIKNPDLIFPGDKIIIPRW